MTSLSQQLRALAVQPSGDFLFGKKRASLLFELTDAAKLDKEAVLGIGRNGFDELNRIDPRFEDFTNLFSESSAIVQRAVLDKETNVNLNQLLNKFLTRLSPYFLLKPSLKCLEWLIYRFHIHECNVSELLKCALPYHDTNVFVRLLQLLRISEEDLMWAWLTPMKTQGVIVPKRILVKKVCVSTAFLDFVCRMAFDALEVFGPDEYKSLQTVFAFYLSTVTSAIDTMSSLSDSFMAQLSPFITMGLRSSCGQLRLASCVILCSICVKAQLTKTALESFLKYLLSKPRADSLKQYMQTAIVLCETQEVASFPKKALKKLLRKAEKLSLLPMLSSLNESTQMSEFIHLLCKGMLLLCQQDLLGLNGSGEQSCDLQHFNLFLQMMNTLKLSNLLSEKILRDTMEVYVETCKVGVSSSQCVELLLQIIGLLSRRHPAAFDRVLDALIATADEDTLPHYTKAIQSTHALQLSKQNSAMTSEVFLASIHPNARIRTIAITQMLKASSLENMNEQAREDFRQMILGIFRDADVDLLQQVLSKFEVSCRLIATDLLIDAMLNLLCDISSSKHSLPPFLTQLLNEKFSALLPCESSLRRRCFQHIVQHLVSLDIVRDTGITTSLLQHKMLLDIGLTKFLPADCAKATPASVLQSLCEWFLESRSDEEKVTMLLAFDKTLPLSSLLIGFCILTILLERYSAKLRPADIDLIIDKLSSFTSILSASSSYVQHFDSTLASSFFSCKDESVLQIDPLIEAVVTLCRSGRSVKIPSDFALAGFWLILRHSKFERKLETCDLADAGPRLNDFVGCLSLLLKALSRNKPRESYGLVLQHFVKAYLRTPNAILSIAIYSHCELNRPNLCVAVLDMLSVCLGALKEKRLRDVFAASQYLLPSLLIFLHSPSDLVRASCLACLQILNGVTALAHGANGLLSLLCSHAEELLLDYQQLPRLLSTFAAATPLDGASPVSNQLTRRITRRGGSAAAPPSAGTAPAAESRLAVSECVASLFEFACNDSVPLRIANMLLQTLKDLHSVAILKQCLSKVRSLISVVLAEAAVESEALTSLLHLLQKFSPFAADALSSGSECVDTFKAVLRTLANPAVGRLRLGLSQVSTSLFAALHKSAQVEIFDCLSDVFLQCELGDVASDIKTLLTTLPLSAELILGKFCIVEADTSSNEKQKTKHQQYTKKLKTVSQPEKLSNELLDRLTLLLEVISVSTCAETTHALMAPLMRTLNKLLQLHADNSTDQADEHLIQLVLGIVSRICSKCLDTGAPLAEGAFSTELIVQCIRQCEAPRTHQLAFELLTVAAQLFREHVLHHVLSIFTFMGTSLMRQDDSFSFEIIHRTLETVIPALVKASKQRADSSAELVNQITNMLQIFVSAWPHIPEHRKLPLFRTLVESASRFDESNLSAGALPACGSLLWIQVGLLIEHSVTGFQKASTVSAPDSNAVSEEASEHSVVEFAMQLQQQFEAHDQIIALSQLLECILALPDEKPKAPTLASATQKPPLTIFDVNIHSEKQLKQFRLAVMKFVNYALQSSDMVSRLAELQPAQFQVIEDVCERFEGKLIALLNHANSRIESSVSKHDENQMKCWKAMSAWAAKCLERLNLLLPVSSCLKMVGGLLLREDISIRRHGLEVLNARLVQVPSPFSHEHVPALSKLTDLLNGWVQEYVSNAPTNAPDEILLLCQSAFYSLKHLVRVTSALETESFNETLKIIVALLERWQSINALLLSNAVLCLADLVVAFGANILEAMTSFVPKLLDILAADNLGTRDSELLAVSTLTCLHKVVETLALFVSPYLETILVQCSLKALNPERCFHLFSAQIGSRLLALKEHLASVPIRVLLPALAAAFKRLKMIDHASLPYLFSVLELHLKKAKAVDLDPSVAALMDFFMLSLDLRYENSKLSEKMLDDLETPVLNAFVSFSLKLSEQRFRPVIARLVSWASSAVDGTNDDDSSLQAAHRLITLFRLCDTLAENLKGLFTLFMAPLLKLVVETLERTNAATLKDAVCFFTGKRAKQDTHQLICVLLSCLTKCFSFDKNVFLTRERFDILMTPLVNQLENRKVKAYDERCSNYLSPCLVSFATSIQDDTALKPLNYQMLLKTRDDSPKIRLATLRLLEAVYTKLGEQFSTLIPETIPFLAELLEDENEEVEAQCHRVISVVEGILGEPLQEYLK